MTRSVVYGATVTLDAGANKWTNVSDPAAAQDAATKAYVDAQVGGTVTAATATYNGDPVTIANNDSGLLTWDTLSLGVELLDRSVLASPTVLADGIYSLCAHLTASALTAAGFGQLSVALLNNADSTNVEPSAILSAAELATVGFSAAVTTVPFALAAGDVIQALCLNYDGAVSRDFSLYQASLTKLA